MHKLLPALWGLVAIFSTELQCHGGGVTIVTHGAGGNIAEWVLPMCERIPLSPRFNGTSATVYKMYLTGSSGNYVVTCNFHQGSSPLVSDSGEIIIALDWSPLSAFIGPPTTATVASVVAGALRSTTLIPDLEGRPLAELPLHLVGHSRGGSMMAELARFLGAEGIWVDHLTLLDPYPNGFNSDPTLRNYANVLFTENYRQANNFPTGATLSGAYDRLLTTLTSGGYGSGSEHSDVHLWYHGTLDFRPNLVVDGVSITANERSTWWTTAEQSGTNAGFVYSAIVGGNRFLTNNPGGSSGRISDGMNKMWNFGAGLAANRTALSANNGQWPNVMRVFFNGTTVLHSSPLNVTMHYQHGTGAASQATLTFCLDGDANPWNTNHVEIGTTTLDGTGTGNVFSTSLDLPDPGGILPGVYPLFVKTTLGSRSRYQYAEGRVTVPPLLTNPHVQGATFGFTVLGRAGWKVIIEETTDLLNWSPISTNTMNAASEDLTVELSDKGFIRALLMP